MNGRMWSVSMKYVEVQSFGMVEVYTFSVEQGVAQDCSLSPI